MRLARLSYPCFFGRSDTAAHMSSDFNPERFLATLGWAPASVRKGKWQ